MNVSVWPWPVRHTSGAALRFDAKKAANTFTSSTHATHAACAVSTGALTASTVRKSGTILRPWMPPRALTSSISASQRARWLPRSKLAPKSLAAPTSVSPMPMRISVSVRPTVRPAAGAAGAVGPPSPPAAGSTAPPPSPPASSGPPSPVALASPPAVGSSRASPTLGPLSATASPSDAGPVEVRAVSSGAVRT